MKKLILLMLFASASAYARNDAATSFATGFAQGLNAQLGGRPYQAPPQYVSQPVYTIPEPSTYDPHWDAVRFDNQRGNYYFFNERECQRFLHREAGTYTTCVQAY